MNKKIAKLVVVGLALISISFFAIVGFSSRLDGLNRGNFLYDEFDQIIGCGGKGDECDWGAPNPNPSPY